MKTLLTFLAVFFLFMQTQGQVQLWEKGKLKTEGNFKWVGTKWIALYAALGSNKSESFQLKNVDSIVVLDSVNGSRMYAQNFKEFIFRPIHSGQHLIAKTTPAVMDTNLNFSENYLRQLDRAGALISEGGENISTGAILSFAGTAVVLLGALSGDASVATLGLIGGGIMSVAGVVTTLLGGIKLQEGGKLLQPKKSN